MAATIWKTSSNTEILISGDPGNQFAPSIADSGGGSFGVAWTSANGVTVRFYDAVGALDPALGTIQLSDGLGTITSSVTLAAGGAVGYAGVWAETSGTEPNASLHMRYVGLTGTIGGEIVVAANAGVVQHNAAMSGYSVDDPVTRKAIVDGFNVVWVETAPGTADSRFGNIMLQRFAVPLDAKVDPLGPPQAAGLDGRITGANNVVNIGNETGTTPAKAVIGRDPSTIVTDAGETVVTWIGTDNNVHMQVYNLSGTIINTGFSGNVVAALNPNTATVAGSAKLVNLAGVGFAVAWVQQQQDGTLSIAGRAFTAGPAPTYNASPVLRLQSLPTDFNGQFSLSSLVDTGGFSVSWTQTNATTGGQDILLSHFNSGGLALDATPIVVNTTPAGDPTAGDQNAPSAAGLLGDRVVTVYQTGALGAQDISAGIVDTRTLPNGDPIVDDGAGLTLNGDLAGRVIADVLVGTVGNDTINGLAGNDQLHGAVGQDILNGGAGDDALFGEGGIDVAVYRGKVGEYTISYLGGDVFTIADKIVGRDGTDTLRGIESFQFSDGVVVEAATFIAGVQPITPTAWGWTSADADTAPDPSGTPDTDGFIVNHAPQTQTGVQSHPYIADSVGQFVGVAWETAPDATSDTHIRGQFYDVIGGFDRFLPNAINLSDGIGIETNPVLVSGGANSGWGVSFEQRDDASDTTHELRTNFVGSTGLTSVELSVDAEGPNVDQHSAAMSSSILDRTLASPVGGSVLPKGMNDGYNVTWISTDLDANGNATDVAGDARYGRVMMQRFEVPLDALGNPGAPAAAGIDGIAGLGSDAAVWVGAESGIGAGVIGRDVSTAALHTFETGVIWIEQDGAGGERVAGRVYDDLGQVAPVADFADISGPFSVAAGTTAKIVSAAAVSFGVVWVTQKADGSLEVMGKYFSSPGTGINGQGFSLGVSDTFELFKLPPGVSAADLNLQATGISGENSPDLIIGWKQSNGTDADMMAQHVKVALDPVTGIAIAMAAEGNAIVVSAGSAGDQDQGNIAGLLGDRFVAAFHDTNNTYTDGNDIVGRIIDTRDPAHPDPIVGDLIRRGVAPAARADVLVGTNGNDTIQGDLSTSVGLVDWIYAGMGDDVIQGGPGLRAFAGVPEIIDGGEGNDVSIYTGRRQDYSITANGDGSIEVIDLRPLADAKGNPLPNDGIDNLYSIETLRFLDLANNGASARDLTVSVPGTPPPLNQINGVAQPPYDGTPVAWSLTDTSQYKEIALDPVGHDIAVTRLQTEAAMAWIKGTDQVWGIRYDVKGVPDPLFSAVPVQLTDGSAAGAVVSDIDIAMTGGLGFTTVWKSAIAGDSTIHLRTGSTNTYVVLDPAAAVPGAGLTSGELVVRESQGSGSQIADQPVVHGYEIVNDANDTIEYGFHVGFVLKNLTTDANGVLELARYEIPVYNLLVNAAGLPILDVNGQGQLARDAAGNFIPAANLGKGVEAAPMSIGLDGLRGTADDGVAIVLTDQGLRLDGQLGGANALQGHDISIASLHDGQLVATYIGDDNHVHLHVYLPHVNQIADRETGGLGGVDVVVPGVTQYSEFALPFSTDLGIVAVGQSQQVVSQQNGSFGVFWAATGVGGTVDIKGIIYNGAGTNWSPTPVFTLASGLAANVSFEVASTGPTPGGLEDGFLLAWQQADAAGQSFQAQRFDMAGGKVGQQVGIDDPTTGAHLNLSASGIDDGRVLLGYQNATGVAAQYLDMREPGVPIIGPRTGAPRDVLVGTVGDDAMDGRALGDELYGGLGNDLLTLGSGADIGDGGAGNDTIVGGPGQDQLLGGDGDDLLWGGVDGTPDAQVDRALRAGLTAAGVAPALVTGENGADIISGGNGTDTISFQGEFGRYNINLATGMVLSDRAQTGTFVLEDVIGQIVDDGAGGTIFTFINDVENATGGEGDDTLIGNAGNNVLDGGLGNNVIDGGAGVDTLLVNANFADVTVSFTAATGTFTFTVPGVNGFTDTVRNVETFVFKDTVMPLPAAVNDTVAATEDTVSTIDVIANDLNTAASAVSKVNGTAITAGGPAVVVSHGSVALNVAGQLVFTPDANYYGGTSFSYTITDNVGRFSTAVVNVNLANTEDAPTDITFSKSPATVAENSAVGTVVATLSTVDPDNAFGVINDAFTYSINPNSQFEVVGSQVRVKAGAVLDFEDPANPSHSYTVTLTTNDGHGGTFTKPLVVNVTNVDEAPVNVGVSALTFAETAANGAAIGTLSATDPEGTAVRFLLADDAGGRFQIVHDATGYSLAVAENLLIDHQTNDANHTYTVQVRALDAGGLSTLQSFTVTATGAGENRIVGTAAANTLNGTAGNDYIDGGAGKDTLTGLAGNDVYRVDDSGDKVVEAANAGTDTVYTTLTSLNVGTFANVENLAFIGTGAFNGTLSNLSGTLIGGAGADKLAGGNGNDVLRGLGGNDNLSGGAGNDTLIGGAGADTLAGGTGIDTFAFQGAFGADIISDFTAAGSTHDWIQLPFGVASSFAALQAAGAVSQVGTDVLIKASATDTITVQKVTVAAIANDFQFA